jgi:hypothetical protein
MLKKIWIMIGALVCALQAVPAAAQQPAGVCYDQARGLTFQVYDNLYMVQVGFPANQGFAQRDPTGLNFLRIPSTTPQFNSFFVDWQGRIIEITPYGFGPAGYCQFNFPMPMNPWQNVYQPPSMAQWGVATPSGGYAVPQALAQTGQRYVRPLVTSQGQADQCLSSSGGEKNAFGDCMLRAMLGSREESVYDCSRQSSSNEDMAFCIVGATGGENERRAAGQLKQCYDRFGDDWNQYPLCFAEQNMNEDGARLLNCVREQSQSGKVDMMGTAICYGAGRLNLNAEAQIAVQCAMASGGEPLTFAGCAGGELTLRELNKCLDYGVGSHDCFGPNNEVVKGLAALGLDVRETFGPNNDLVRTWNNGVNDLRNGPGPNNDIVRVANTIYNDVTHGPGPNNDIVRAIDNALPGFTESVGDAVCGLFGC